MGLVLLVLLLAILLGGLGFILHAVATPLGSRGFLGPQ
jgi:hypothetical protein